MLAAISQLTKWQQAFCCTALISIIPNLFLLLIPARWLVSNNRAVHSRRRIIWTHACLAFAAGGLLGDVLLHALPHLLSESNSHGHCDTIDYHEQLIMKAMGDVAECRSSNSSLNAG